MGANDCKYVVCDDVNFQYIPGWIEKGLWGAQDEMVVSDKYTRKMIVKGWGKPLIWICNEDKDPRQCPNWTQWHNDNCVYVNINESLID